MPPVVVRTLQRQDPRHNRDPQLQCRQPAAWKAAERCLPEGPMLPSTAVVSSDSSPVAANAAVEGLPIAAEAELNCGQASQKPRPEGPMIKPMRPQTAVHRPVPPHMPEMPEERPERLPAGAELSRHLEMPPTVEPDTRPYMSSEMRELSRQPFVPAAADFSRPVHVSEVMQPRPDEKARLSSSGAGASYVRPPPLNSVQRQQFPAVAMIPMPPPAVTQSSFALRPALPPSRYGGLDANHGIGLETGSPSGGHRGASFAFHAVSDPAEAAAAAAAAPVARPAAMASSGHVPADSGGSCSGFRRPAAEAMVAPMAAAPPVMAAARMAAAPQRPPAARAPPQVGRGAAPGALGAVTPGGSHVPLPSFGGKPPSGAGSAYQEPYLGAPRPPLRSRGGEGELEGRAPLPASRSPPPARPPATPQPHPAWPQQAPAAAAAAAARPAGWQIPPACRPVAAHSGPERLLQGPPSMRYGH
eukprot:NODE_4576_length_1874_cov_3.605610.p1 GENE.NODE_4576_length_1874_cov_3.605610~~NODE_4576_length_1874_cov_3.605610.p1  ORF type:complete len:472 (-),score=65.05 NODE_4576_length_1874_cov_3.605610:95-1510(-)